MRVQSTERPSGRRRHREGPRPSGCHRLADGRRIDPECQRRRPPVIRGLVCDASALTALLFDEGSVGSDASYVVLAELSQSEDAVIDWPLRAQPPSASEEWWADGCR